MLFGLLIVVVVLLGLLYWYLKDYMRTGALKKVQLVGTKVPMEREKFIPLLRSGVVSALKSKVGGEKGAAAFDKLVDKLALAVKLENRALLGDLLQDFELVDPTQSKAHRAAVAKERRSAAEQRFLRNFMHMMDKANFKLLTKAELEFAEAEQYLLQAFLGQAAWRVQLPLQRSEARQNHASNKGTVTSRVSSALSTTCSKQSNVL